MSMELDNSFTVPVPPDRAWDVLLDVERIAPCMPGATVEEFDGEVVTGRIKVKVGPVSLTYRGTAKFIERDPEGHRANTRALLDWCMQGKLSSHVHAVYSLAEGPAALRAIAARKVMGKVILRP